MSFLCLPNGNVVLRGILKSPKGTKHISASSRPQIKFLIFSSCSSKEYIYILKCISPSFCFDRLKKQNI